jgi:hypothetical protein
MEVPTESAPDLIASADEAQAAQAQEDPAHAQAEQQAQQVTEQQAAVIETADVAPGSTEGDAPAAADAGVTEGDAADAEAVGGDIDAIPEGGTDNGAGAEGGDDGADLGGDTGGEASGDLGADASGADDTGTGSDSGLGDGGSDDFGGGDSVGGDAGDSAGTSDDAGAEGTTGEAEPDVAADAVAGDDSAAAGDDAGTDTGADDTAAGTDADAGTDGDAAADATGDVDTGADAGGDFGGDDASADSGGEATGDDANAADGDAGADAGGDAEAGDAEGGDEGGEDAGEGEGETEGEEETTPEEDAQAEEDLANGDIDVPDVDTETTDEDVADAEITADDKVEEDEKLEDEIIDTSKSINEVDEETAAVEHFMGVLSYGIRNKEFSNQTMALATEKMLSLAKAMGNHSPVVPSVESYSAANIEDHYKASLESFGEFWKRLKHARKNMVDAFAKKMNDKMHLKAPQAEIDALNKKLDLQITKIGEAKMESELEVKLLPAVLHFNDGVIKGITGELKALTEMGSSVFKADSVYIESLIACVKEGISAPDGTKAAAAANKALKLAAPYTKYPASVWTFKGGFEIVKPELKATGDLVADMKSLRKRVMPQCDYLENPNGHSSASLKKADVVKLLQLCKVLVGLSNATSSVMGKKLVAAIDSINRSGTESDMANKKAGEAAEVKRGTKALEELMSQAWWCTSASLETYGLFQERIIDLVRAVLSVTGRVAK